MLIRRLSVFAVMCIAWCAAGGAVQADLMVRGFDANLHNRFANHPDFIGISHDWSGVGRNSQWATMISDSFFLSATHSHPGNGTNVTFFHSNDPAGASESHAVAEGWGIGTSDLWLGRLATSVSTSVAKYAIADVSPAAAESLDFLTFGLASGFAPAARQRVGRNEVDLVLPAFSDPALAGAGDVFIYDYDLTGGVGDDEARVAGGDSGAPTFFLSDSGPAILGIHWFLYTEDDLDGGSGSGDTFVPSYIDALNARMAPFGESLTIVSVPEPSSVVLYGLALGFVIIRHRRRVHLN
ncbi:PEP-CTERM sorting domain-containing protein [Fuerstiella marisgermanici]|uniref:PEP-CTERM protein-sorting domain-containing protein n=1 Tax=Fuerstiella marisgermanici TaxID=1891926 RepID=A0A1P8WLQ8_9PLAN|nr:PEP-CTERM sorting domain-containing protein [Fuerstiella marisgermanici]APZ94993.1 hypothetical protein Fuma_04645 [Fuerstiella marisgermanici]